MQLSDDVAAVRLDAVSKVYGRGAGTVQALRDVSVSVPHRTFIAVMGLRSGKSTLLHVAAGLDRPTEGRVSIGATELSGLSATRLTELRRDRIGFVFQAFNLLPTLTVEQNVTLPLGLPAAGRRTLARRGARPGRTDRSASTGLRAFGVSSSGSPWPGRYSPSRRWCSRTSRPARWIWHR